MADAPIKTRMKLAEFHQYLDEHPDRERFLELIDGVVEDKSSPNEVGPISTATHEMPLLVVGIMNTHRSRGEITAEAEYHLANGTKQVWIIYTHIKKVEVLTMDDMELYAIGDSINGSDLLPGFTLDVSALFDYQRAE
jgi:Uma2 family endonuclease